MGSPCGLPVPAEDHRPLADGGLALGPLSPEQHGAAHSMRKLRSTLSFQSPPRSICIGWGSWLLSSRKLKST